MTRLVCVVGLVALAAAAWSAQRGWRMCVCCKPRRRFATVDLRRRHEHIHNQ